MEMIFHYKDLYKQYFEDGSSVIQPRSFIFGQITKYIEIGPSGVSGIVAARFLPDGLIPFLTMPVLYLENKAVGLAEIFGEKGKKLEQEVMSASDNQQRIKLIEAFLLSRLNDQHSADTIIKSCIDAIFHSQGQLSVLQLAGTVNVNRRSVERKFIAAIGMSPKQLSRVVRLQAAMKMLEHKDFTSLTSLAYENGYYDQAHFIKDFKEFTGTSPKSFFADNLRYAALFAAAE
jgi:AraC-like DNA-binding protein